MTRHCFAIAFQSHVSLACDHGLGHSLGSVITTPRDVKHAIVELPRYNLALAIDEPEVGKQRYYMTDRPEVKKTKPPSVGAEAKEHIRAPNVGCGGGAGRGCVRINSSCPGCRARLDHVRLRGGRAPHGWRHCAKEFLGQCLEVGRAQWLRVFEVHAWRHAFPGLPLAAGLRAPTNIQNSEFWSAGKSPVSKRFDCAREVACRLVFRSQNSGALTNILNSEL